MIKIEHYRWIGTLEAISFLILLGLAMPLKYIWGYPQAVSVVGMAHGVLFILYLYGSIVMKPKLSWSYGVLAVVLFCAIIPFGPFYAERKYLP
jgi:integral membrane protein